MIKGIEKSISLARLGVEITPAETIPGGTVYCCHVFPMSFFDTKVGVWFRLQTDIVAT